MKKIEGFDTRIKELLAIKFGGNRSQFAKVLGVSEARMRSYEDGVTPGADMIIKIAKTLEVSCEWLLVGTDVKDNYSEVGELGELVKYLREKDKKIESLIAKNAVLEAQLKTKK